MRRLVSIVLVLALVVYAFRQYRGATDAAERERAAEPAPAAEVVQLVVSPPAESISASSGTYRCDGRTRCSEMTSCAEAMYFLQNCPGVKMDGEGDGVPCEGQWCGHR